MNVRTEKFELGEIVITPAAGAAIAENGDVLASLLTRHQNGDWGEISETVRAVNDRGLSDHFNLQSAYRLEDGRRLAVVTNRQRTVTIVHLDVPV